MSSMLLLLLLAAPREVIGVHFGWGAFRDGGRCSAMTEPQRPGRDDARPHVALTFAPEQNQRGQFYVRLRRPSRDGSAVLLRIDGVPFQLLARGSDAWSPSARADAAIVQAVRTGVSMTVESRSTRGVTVRDLYLLRGAATAIDAAAIACLKAAGKKPQSDYIGRL